MGVQKNLDRCHLEFLINLTRSGLCQTKQHAIVFDFNTLSSDDANGALRYVQMISSPDFKHEESVKIL